MHVLQGHTYQRLQQLQVGQCPAQEPHTGRPGGEERVHCHQVTLGPVQQAWKSSQRQSLSGHLPCGLATCHRPQLRLMSETRLEVLDGRLVQADM